MSSLSSLDGCLVVPMHVDALCIGNATDSSAAVFVPPGADFTRLPYVAADGGIKNRAPYVSDTVTRDPATIDLVTREHGIHLHWTLPSALAHGQASGCGGAVMPTMPEVPNRWLIVRTVTDSSTGATSQQSWVIESDRVGTAAGDSVRTVVPAIPQKKGDLPYAYLGVTKDGGTWKEGSDPDAVYLSATSDRLTALGAGAPHFAALYTECCGVFGFHDTMAGQSGDVPKSVVGYTVIGWFGATQTDFLATIPAPADPRTTWRENLAQRCGWIVPLAPDGKADRAPTTSIYCGSVHGIAWDPTTGYLETNPRDLNISRAALGNSPAEALAALLASMHTDHETAIEDLLNSLLLGALAKSDADPDAASNLREALRRGRFRSLAGGTVSMLKQQPPANSAPGNEAPLPAAVAPLLSQLNGLEEELNTLQRTIASLRWQLFVDWWKYQEKSYGPDGDPALAGVIAQYFDATLSLTSDGPLATAMRRVTQLLDFEIPNARTDLAAALEGSSWQVVSTPAEPFWQPNAPAVLLLGPDVAPRNRFTNTTAAGGDGTIICRLGTQVASTLWIAPAAFGNTAAISLQPADLGVTLGTSVFPQPELFAALLGEARLLDPTLAPAIVAALATKVGKSFAGSGAAAAIDAARSTIGRATDGCYLMGTAPDPSALNDWRDEPWNPFILAWTAHYFPAQYLNSSEAMALYRPDLLTSDYALSDVDDELHYTGSSAPTEYEVYDGYTFLTPQSRTSLRTQLLKYCSNHPTDPLDPDLTAIAEAIDGMELLAQGLGGWNEALVMRDQATQLPVLDPLGSPLVQRRAKLAAAGVAEMNLTAPNTGACFNPIRGGFMLLQSVRVIDSFGRCKQIGGENLWARMVRAESMTRPACGATLAELPPRLTQPSRLSARLLPAANDAWSVGPVPASTPVCGWLLANHLDDSLAVYDAQGTGIGSFIYLANDGGSAAWQVFPGTPNAPTPADAFAHANRHLAGFALDGIWGWKGTSQQSGSGAMLGALLAALSAAGDSILPGTYKQTQGNALLLGHPFALVRMAVRLDLHGLPAADESYRSFFQLPHFDPENPPERWHAGFTAVQLPLRVGGTSRTDDGVVGYFIERNGRVEYGQFFSPFAPTVGNGPVVRPTLETLLLTAGPAADELVIMLIIDPRAGVPVQTPLLPRRTLKVPTAHYAPALGALKVAFFTAPVLSDAQTLAMPLPAQGAGRWSWVAQSAPGKWTQTNDVASAGQSATLAPTPQSLREGWLVLDASFENQ